MQRALTHEATPSIIHIVREDATAASEGTRIASCLAMLKKASFSKTPGFCVLSGYSGSGAL
jgi:hypothetical protein